MEQKIFIFDSEGVRAFDEASGEMCHVPVQEALPSCIELGRNQKLDLVFIVLPGASCDVPMTLELAGEGAEAALSGVYLCSSDERLSIGIDLVHAVPHCTSHQLFKGIVGGSAKVDFYGKVYVAKDAQQTEAYQENHNLLLSEGARVNTKPQLEIYADDVKCTHGATVGRLNEDEQFYMRSRGISLEDARMLQMLSFLAPVLSRVEDEELRTTLIEEISLAIKNNL